ncbi:hypothetical protein J4E90_002369 [Alternaria incomplexa]|uniref:uncharacterized protein n=1 Tax=Alternaria incomplexa TaxID=1187928 RepID=UPI002221266B|nr:uncharacterized protein J4E90_002369 [Alternaria incomplexa]KAI4920228.1 hypothetical protein J4E90_002369 [Alternaria incomplexa]
MPSIEDAANSAQSRKKRRLSEATIQPFEEVSSCAYSEMHQAVETEDFVRRYPATAMSSLKRGICMLEELNTQVQESSIAQTRKKRFIAESQSYIDVIKTGEDVVPISAKEYELRIQQSTPNWENNLIICTSTEARDLLQRLTLQIPLLIPSELNNSLTLRTLYSAQHYEAVLKFRKDASAEAYMDIQDLTSKNITRRLTISTALKRMSDPTALPINLLDIRPVRQNLLPWELDNLTDYSILSEATEYGGMSNHSDPNPSDLSSKTGFALWGKRGVWSFPHVDEHGLYTGVLCESGSKLWFTWSLSPSEREQWAVSRQAGFQYAPNKPGFPIYLKKGDLLLMPPGTVHAPLSLEDVIMHGVHVWCSKTMVSTAESALLDLRFPMCTNEEPRRELRGKLMHLVRASKARLGPYTWGDHEEFAELVGRIMVVLEGLERKERLP